MKNSTLKNWLKKLFFLFVFVMVTANQAFASTSSGSLPFASSMGTLKDEICGPFLLAASTIMCVITCLMLAFGDWGDSFKRLLNIVFWLSICFGVVGFINTLFGGGAVF